MNQTTWADLDRANLADRHYTRWPEFYRLALQAKEQAEIDWNDSLEEWNNCPEWPQGRRRQLLDRVKLYEGIYLETCAALRVLYYHWQRLIGDSQQECNCNGLGDACPACVARRRLNDPTYEPTLSQLLHEE